MGAEDPTVGVREQLGEARGVLHRPPVGGVGVHLPGGDVADPLLAGLLLGQSDGGDLRVAEDRAGDRVVVAAHPRRGVVEVEQVVLHDPRLVVGDVLELVAVAHVAQRPHPLRRGVLEVVHDHEAVGHLDPGPVQVEPVGVGGPAGGEQQRVGLQRARTVDRDRRC